MRCGSCVSKVKSILEGDPPVVGASVNLATETAMVRVLLDGAADAGSAAAEEGRSLHPHGHPTSLGGMAAHLAEVGPRPFWPFPFWHLPSAMHKGSGQIQLRLAYSLQDLVGDDRLRTCDVLEQAGRAMPGRLLLRMLLTQQLRLEVCTFCDGVSRTAVTCVDLEVGTGGPHSC